MSPCTFRAPKTVCPGKRKSRRGQSGSQAAKKWHQTLAVAGDSVAVHQDTECLGPSIWCDMTRRPGMPVPRAEAVCLQPLGHISRGTVTVTQLTPRTDLALT